MEKLSNLLCGNVVVRQDIYEEIISVTRTLSDICFSSYGPCGRFKVIQSNKDLTGCVTLTSCSGRIFQESKLSSNSPVAFIIVNALLSQVNSSHDGGLYMMGFATELLYQALTCTKFYSRQLKLQGFDLAYQWCLEYLRNENCPCTLKIIWSDPALLLACIRSVVDTKAKAAFLSIKDVDHVLEVILQGFISIIQRNDASIKYMRYLYIEGDDITQSNIEKDVLYLDIQVSLKKEGHNLSVALFSISLEFPDFPTKLALPISFAMKQSALFAFANRLLDLKVGIVASQKLIHPFLKRYFLDNGIIPLERLSLCHIETFHYLTGAVIISNLQSTVTKEDLGFLSTFQRINLGSKTYVRLSVNVDDNVFKRISDKIKSRMRPMTSIIIYATNPIALAELKYTVENAMLVLLKMIEQPLVVAGAGSAEIHMAKYLRQRQDTLSLNFNSSLNETKLFDVDVAAIQNAIITFADCLEKCVSALDHSGLNKQFVLSELHQKNVSTLSEKNEEDKSILYGWNPILSCPTPVMTYTTHKDKREFVHAHVLDSLDVKINALTAAMDIVTAIMKMDGMMFDVA